MGITNTPVPREAITLSVALLTKRTKQHGIIFCLYICLSEQKRQLQTKQAKQYANVLQSLNMPVPTEDTTVNKTSRTIWNRL
jgi:hypothetical protein